jgi:signal peptidase II
MKENSRLALRAAVLTLAADWLSKYWVQRLLPAGQPVPVFPGFNLTYVLNTGAAFSLLSNLPAWLRFPFFSAVTLAALGAIFFMLRGMQARDRLTSLALGLVAGGALGNLWDRFRLGRVVDFLEFGVPRLYTWPVFNLADSAVCVGVGLLILKSFRKEPKASV